ncbi:MAG TPA: glycosyltransferase family 2 protein, partial [Chthoniobacterales bacterium]
MRAASPTHAILLPSYNSGEQLSRTLEKILPLWRPVIVVVDGSTDGSGQAARARFGGEPDCHFLMLARNRGKGGAAAEGFRLAERLGLTHVLVMDADGQHSEKSIAPFMQASFLHPHAMILGVPVFGPDAPAERVRGRAVGNWWANLATWWGGIHDSLFGLRVYPVKPARRIMDAIRTARRFDFDTELAVRLYWAGIAPISLPAPVRYPPATEGGVTHFRYLRDNLLLAGTH